jgi:predicted dehydrogenase
MSDAVLNQFTPTSREEAVIDTTNKLKFGIIGTGWIAEAHVESLKQMKDVEIVAGSDLVPGKAEKFFKLCDPRRMHNRRAGKGRQCLARKTDDRDS